MKVLVKRLSDSARLPERQHEGDAGYDLIAAERASLLPGRITVVDTGIAFQIPRGTVLYVCSRSGLAKRGISVANSPGVVDSGFSGSVKVILQNQSTVTFEIQPGDRIAQAILAPIYSMEFNEVEDLNPSERGDNGLGSTGV